MKVTLPEAGQSSPDMVLNNVVLPAPFEPINATISASLTYKETSHNAWTLPYEVLSLFTSSI
jgi:hypothetical protein